jgi:iron complex outermembrane receptor protein
MRLTLLIIALLFASEKCLAQFIVKGTINDAVTQQPIFGAAIYLPDLKKGTTSDIDGRYRIGNLPRGKFLMEVKYVGYASWVQTLEVTDSVQLNISLNSSITELNEIIITGISHSTELKKNPVSIATLNADALQKNTSTNIIDNVSQKAGIYQITTGAAISKPVIRGLGYNRIITLYDGTRQEGQQWGDEHGIEIDEFSVDRVEIIKGAGSLMYGSDGIGGVINLLAPNPVREGKVVGQWTSNYQSNNGLIANSIMNAGNIKGLYWNVRASQKNAKAYQNAYDGRVFNSGFNERDFSALTGVNKSWGYTQFTVSSFAQKIGLIEGERDSQGNFIRLKDVNGTEEQVAVPQEELNSYKLFVPKQSINHLRLANSTNLFLGNYRMQLNVGYQRNQRREFGDVLNETQPNLFFDLGTTNYSLNFFFPETNGWNFSVGTTGMSQQNKNRGKEFLIPEYQLWDWGVVGFLKKNINKLDVAAGLRFDQRNLSISALYLDDNGDPTTSAGNLKFNSGNLLFSNYSASAGIAYQFSDYFSIKANTSRGFRAPNISELASNGRHEGSLRYEYGNYNLKAETSFQADFSMLFNSPHVSGEVSIYQNNINHYIFVEKLLAKNGADSIPDPSAPVPGYFYTQGKAQLRGGEFTIDLHPHPFDWLHFENSLSIVYAENKTHRSDSSRYLPFTPPPRLQSELRANAKHWKNFANVFFKIQYQHYGKQDRVLLENRTETVTPGYQLWNAGCGFDFLNHKQRNVLSLYFTANNVFDKAYQNHLSRLKYAAENPLTGRPGVFNMGRNFSIKLIIPVTFRDK